MNFREFRNCLRKPGPNLREFPTLQAKWRLVSGKLPREAELKSLVEGIGPAPVTQQPHELNLNVSERIIIQSENRKIINISEQIIIQLVDKRSRNFCKQIMRGRRGHVLPNLVSGQAPATSHLHPTSHLYPTSHLHHPAGPSPESDPPAPVCSLASSPPRGLPLPSEEC